MRLAVRTVTCFSGLRRRRRYSGGLAQYLRHLKSISFSTSSRCNMTDFSSIYSLQSSFFDQHISISAKYNDSESSSAAMKVLKEDLYESVFHAEDIAQSLEANQVNPREMYDNFYWPIFSYIHFHYDLHCQSEGMTQQRRPFFVGLSAPQVKFLCYRLFI